MMQFEILEATDIDSLSYSVNNLIRDGWELNGHVFFAEGSFHQAMTKGSTREQKMETFMIGNGTYQLFTQVEGEL